MALLLPIILSNIPKTDLNFSNKIQQLNSGTIGFFYKDRKNQCQPNIQQIIQSVFNKTITVFDVSINYTRLDHPYVAKPESTVIFSCGYDEEIVDKWYDHAMVNSHGPVLVITNSPNTKAQNWLKVLWEKARAVHTAVLTSEGDFYTWYPYQPNECTNVSTIVKLNELELFPTKDFTNIHGCGTKAATRDMVPYVFDHQNGEFKGVEVNALQMMLGKINGTLEFVKIPENVIILATLSEDNQRIGGAKLLHEHYTDIIFAQLKMSIEFNILTDILYPHCEDDLLWWVPQPKLLDSIHYLYLAFDLSTWIGISIVYIMFSLVMINGYKSASLTFLNTTALTINLALSLPRRKILQFLALYCLIVYSVNISTLYQASLLKLFSTKPTVKKICTPIEAIEKGIKPHLFTSIIKFINSPESTIWAKIMDSHNYEIKPLIDYINVLKSGKGMLLLPKTFILQTIAENNLYDDHLRPISISLPERQMAIMSMFCMSIGHPLRDELDKALKQIVEGGFVQWWLKTYISAIKNPSSVSVSPIAFKDIGGAIYVLLMLEIIAVGIFLLELFLS